MDKAIIELEDLYAKVRDEEWVDARLKAGVMTGIRMAMARLRKAGTPLIVKD
jgi:hypothetical protein